MFFTNPECTNFSYEIFVSFSRGLQIVFFCNMINSYISIWSRTHLVPGLPVPPFLSPWKNGPQLIGPSGQMVPIQFGHPGKNRRFVGLGIVKKCDELDHGFFLVQLGLGTNVKYGTSGLVGQKCFRCSHRSANRIAH